MFRSKNKVTDLNKFVVEKMAECHGQENFSCYKNIANILSSEFNMKDVLAVFEMNEKDPLFFEKCHTTLHFLGQEEYKITNNVSESLGEGTPICFAGFYHGVLEAYLLEENIKDPNELSKLIPTICNGLTPQKNRNECLHGLGHALMFATDGELPQALEICDSMPRKEDRDWCYSGAFMENSTSSTNKDHPSKYLSEMDVMYPCNILSSKYLNMCYTLQGFYFAELKGYDWQETAKLCLKVPEPYDTNCFNSIGQGLVGYTQDPEIIKKECLMLPPKFQRDCISGVIGATIERYGDGKEKIGIFCGTLERDLKKICENITNDQ